MKSPVILLMIPAFIIAPPQEYSGTSGTLRVITDEIAGNTIDGTGIHNRTAFTSGIGSVITDKTAGNITDGTAVSNRAAPGIITTSGSLHIITDKISGYIVDGTTIINCPAVGNLGLT